MTERRHVSRPRVPLHFVLGSVPADGPYVIYALCDQADPSHVRYVGYSYRPSVRFIEHVTDAQRHRDKTRKATWIRSVFKSGGDVLWRPLRYATCRAEASFLEQAFVRGYGLSGHRLTNGTAGGDGGLLTPDVRAKQSASMKRLAETKPESRARMTNALRSEEALLHQRAAMQTPAVRAKCRAANLGRKHSAAIRAKLSEAQKRRWVGTVMSAEEHANRSAGTKLGWARRKGIVV